MPNTERRTF